ncbi:MAG: Crp/Fnr family transcriptional regulator [Anaerovoracaceae bacterium]|jgi:CRP/FNR family transcriptional regulator
MKTAAILKKAFPFWDDLADKDKDMLISSATSAEYEKGQTLHYGSDDCLGMMIVVSGCMRVYLLSDDGRDVTLYRLEKGDVCILSASCVLNSITFDVNIDAECDTRAILVDAARFRDLAEREVEVSNYANHLSTSRFSQVMWTMQQILFMGVDRRLAIFLQEEAQKKDTVDIRATHEQIASYIGSAREVVSRMLKYFENEGIVSLSRGQITIRDMSKLNALAG